MTPLEIYISEESTIVPTKYKSEGFTMSHEEYQDRKRERIKREFAEIPWKKLKSKEDFTLFLKQQISKR